MPDCFSLRGTGSGLCAACDRRFENCQASVSSIRKSWIVEVHDRLMFDAVVSGRRLPHSTQSRVRVYNCQGLHLRYGLARSTISQSRDTKREVDQGREIGKIGAALLCEGNQAIAPVSSEFGGERWPIPLVGSDRKLAATFGRRGSTRLIALPANGATIVGRPPYGRSGQSSPLGEVS